MIRKKDTQKTARISTQLYGTLRELYFRELKFYLKQPNNNLSETNAFAPSSLVFFPMSICVWEAVVNEIFLSISADWHFRDNPILCIKDKMEKWSIEDKTFKFPKLFLNNSFNDESLAYDHFKILLKLRNSITHYKYSAENSPDIQIKKLIDINVISNVYDTVWYMKLFSTECMRFCINSISEMAVEMEKCCNNQQIFSSDGYSSITQENIKDFISNRPVYGVSFLYEG
jgi:hypothetical protein